MARNKETNLQLQIMVALSRECVLVRVPAGMYWAGKIRDGIIIKPRAVRVAMPGHPDIAGYRRSDGKAIYIEVKTGKGRVTTEQEKFLDQAKQAGCLAGVARSIKEAMTIVRGDV